MKEESLIKKFKEAFDQVPLLVKSPGRINLIGEHTDYNNGFVMPAAIDKAFYVAIQKSSSVQCNLIAIDLNESYQFNINDEMKPIDVGWANYFLGVVDQMKKRNHKMEGFNIVFSSDVPLGAGLSSSAALECAFGFGLSELFNFNLKLTEIALIGQQAEHTFAGVKCGIMDQYASCMGKNDCAMLLDCKYLTHEYIPCDLGEYQFILLDSQVKHNLADSEYNIRRQQCEKGVEIIRAKNPKVRDLRDVTLSQLDHAKGDLDPIVFKRCMYVVKENHRVHQAADALKKGNILELGQLMFETHEGLSEEYEVSCKELDLLYEFAKNAESIVGARMMGGGFGGCTINLIKRDRVDSIVSEISKKYKEKTNINLRHYAIEISDGVSVVG